MVQSYHRLVLLKLYISTFSFTMSSQIIFIVDKCITDHDIQSCFCEKQSWLIHFELSE